MRVHVSNGNGRRPAGPGPDPLVTALSAIARSDRGSRITKLESSDCGLYIAHRSHRTQTYTSTATPTAAVLYTSSACNSTAAPRATSPRGAPTPALQPWSCVLLFPRPRLLHAVHRPPLAGCSSSLLQSCSCPGGPNLCGPNLCGPNLCGPNLCGPNLCGPKPPLSCFCLCVCVWVGG
jgi:hypothetical protein